MLTDHCKYDSLLNFSSFALRACLTKSGALKLNSDTFKPLSCHTLRTAVLGGGVSVDSGSGSGVGSGSGSGAGNIDRTDRQTLIVDGDGLDGCIK